MNERSGSPQQSTRRMSGYNAAVYGKAPAGTGKGKRNLKRKTKRRKRQSRVPGWLIFLLVLLLNFGVVTAAVVFLRRGMQEAEDRALRAAYPLPEEYRGLIEKYAAEYGVPQSIVWAVTLCESSFDPDAVSHAGAVGLMQLTPETFWWLCSKTKESLPDSALTEPEVNLRYGTLFLSMLKEEFGSWQKAFAAYNAGRTRLNNWLGEGTVTEDETGFLSGIPIGETAEYVVKVRDAAEMYARIYGLN